MSIIYAGQNRKNYIQNANFELWDYATSQASGDSGFGCANRWYNHESVACTRTVSQMEFDEGQTDVEGNPQYYIRTIITDAGTGDSGNFINMNQRIENVRTLSGENVTLSFYAKASSSLNLSTEFIQYFGQGGSASTNVGLIGVQKHSLTTSWQKFTKTVTIPSISTKIIDLTDYFDSSYLKIRFYMSAGSDWNTNTDSLGFQTGTFDIANVQLEKGLTVTPFEFVSPAQNRVECARYYIPNLYVGGSGQSSQTSVNFSAFSTYPKMRCKPNTTVTTTVAVKLGSYNTVQSNGNGYIEIIGTIDEVGGYRGIAFVELDAEMPTY